LSERAVPHRNSNEKPVKMLNCEFRIEYAQRVVKKSGHLQLRVNDDERANSVINIVVTTRYVGIPSISEKPMLYE
jgi:hypothetical protein